MMLYFIGLFDIGFVFTSPVKRVGRFEVHDIDVLVYWVVAFVLSRLYMTV